MPATSKEKELICDIQAEIHDLLSDIGAGVQEIRHGVTGEIADILDDSKFTANKLIRLLDAKPSVIEEIMNESEEESDVESLSTETLDGYLKILRKKAGLGSEDAEEDATNSLQEMKQQACDVFGNSVTRLGLSKLDLVEMLDERPSVVHHLMEKVSPSISTEKILEHLDTLRTQLTQRL